MKGLISFIGQRRREKIAELEAHVKDIAISTEQHQENKEAQVEEQTLDKSWSIQSEVRNLPTMEPAEEDPIDYEYSAFGIAQDPFSVDSAHGLSRESLPSQASETR